MFQLILRLISLTEKHLLFAGDPDYNWTITEVEYKVDGHVQTIKKADYEDYFAIDGTALKIFRS